MDLFVSITLSAIVVLLAVCAYCLSLAVSLSNNDPELNFLAAVTKVTRKIVIWGGVGWLLFIAWCLIVAFAMYINPLIAD